MAATEKYQGDDIVLSITVGSSVNIDNLAELFVYVIHKHSGAVLVKFSKAGATGYTALVKVTTTNYKAYVKSSLTKTAATGIYIIDANVIETNIAFESSKKNTITLSDTINLLSSTSKAESSG